MGLPARAKEHAALRAGLRVVPRRPAIRFYGGKWRIAPWIIGHFSEHDCYVEPFAGAASVLMRKDPSKLEYYNDADKELVNFFQVLRERGEDLVRAIELTPFSREELRLSREVTADPLERARRLYVWFMQGRGGHASKTGWRFQRLPSRRKTAVGDFSDTTHLPAVIARLKQVALECDDVFSVLERYDAPTTLFYVDPPYLESVRAKSTGRYGVEFKSDEDHRRLAETLCGLAGKVIVSGMACDLYAELYEAQGWARRDREFLNQASKKATESIWINPAASLPEPTPLSVFA